MTPLRSLLLVALVAASPAHAERRIALIIANETYAAANLGRLPGTKTDAARIATALRGAGFTDIVVARDLKRDDLRAAIGLFTRKLAAAGSREGVGFLYFAGHGIADSRIKQNYLIPVDAQLKALSDLPLYAVPMDDILASIESTDAKAVFVVFDACRVMPDNLTRGSRGLVPSRSAAETLIAYSTAPNTTADDNGVYARLLAEEIGRSGATSETVFARTQTAVARATNRQQVPQFLSGVTETITFTPEAARPVVADTGIAAARRALDGIPERDWRARYGGELVEMVLRSTSFASIVDLAQRGDARAMFIVGCAYYSGLNGLRIDKAVAVGQFRLAANLGFHPAESTLAYSNFSGEDGIPINKAEALRLYRSAAARGNAFAQGNLGNMYLSGDYVAQDKAEAARLYKLAADAGYAVGEAGLGLLYSKGEGGLPQDKVEAARYYKLAAAKNESSAMANLGDFFYSGSGGLAENKIEALRLFRASAAAGNKTVHAWLGLYAERGEGGVVQDRAEAIRHYRIAAKAGDVFAQNRLRAWNETW